MLFYYAFDWFTIIQTCIAYYNNFEFKIMSIKKNETVGCSKQALLVIMYEF